MLYKLEGYTPILQKSVLVYKKGLFKYVEEQQIMKSINIIQNKLKSKNLKFEDMKIINYIDTKMATGMLVSEESIKYKSNSH